MKTKFFEIISDSVGNISSRRFRKEYFIKNGYSDVWNWFENECNNFPEYSDTDVAVCIKYDYTEPPKCICCNKPSKVQRYGGKVTFDYCSRECSLKSPERARKLSETKRNYSDERKQEIENKRSKTNIEKYGVEYQSQRKEIKSLIGEKLTKRYLTTEVIEKLNNKEWLYQEYVIYKRDSVDIAEELGVFYGTVLDYCRKYEFKIRKKSSNSRPQREIFEFIQSFYSGEILYDHWDILGNKELDIYVPDLKLAIEHNGLPSHSFIENSKKAKEKHIDKTNRCNNLGIRLIHIRGDQWIKQKDLVKSMIKNVMGFTERKIHARKCEIKLVDTDISRQFLLDNHIQGFCGASIKLGLYYDDELVNLMTFGVPRNKSNKLNYAWELIRFCSVKNTIVIGGFSKLLKHFRKNNAGNIISYCDRSISNGNIYIKNGFVSVIQDIKPGYSWTDCHTVFSRELFQKHKLKTLYEIGKLTFYDASLTEFENMIMNRYRIIYDSGQIPFAL